MKIENNGQAIDKKTQLIQNSKVYMRSFIQICTSMIQNIWQNIYNEDKIAEFILSKEKRSIETIKEVESNEPSWL